MLTWHCNGRDGVGSKGNFYEVFPVVDLERGIVAILQSFKQCRTDMKVVQHYAPLKI